MKKFHLSIILLSLSAASLANPFLSQEIINDAAELAATGKGIEVYLDQEQPINYGGYRTEPQRSSVPDPTPAEQKAKRLAIIRADFKGKNPVEHKDDPVFKNLTEDGKIAVARIAFGVRSRQNGSCPELPKSIEKLTKKHKGKELEVAIDMFDSGKLCPRNK